METEPVLKLLDGVAEDGYDDHRILSLAAMRMGKTDASPLFLPGSAYEASILPEGTARGRAPHSGRGVEFGGKPRPGMRTT